MACNGEVNKFDQFTTMLASGMTRRDTLKWVGAAALGTMLSVVGIRKAEALAGGCTNKGVCETYTPCDGAPTKNTCACGTRAKGVKGWCFQNVSCAGLTPCKKNSDCTHGDTPVKCVVNTCCGSGGVCLAKCSAPIPPNGVTLSGRTATG